MHKPEAGEPTKKDELEELRQYILRTEEKFKRLFERAGVVRSVQIVTGKNGRVQMSSPEEAGKAIKMLNGRWVQGMKVSVQHASSSASDLDFDVTRPSDILSMWARPLAMWARFVLVSFRRLRRNLPGMLYYFVYFIPIMVIVVGLIWSSIVVRRYFDRGSTTPITTSTLEQQLTPLLVALQENSQRAMSLLTRLQADISSSAMAAREIEEQLKELREQKKLLEELTPQQKRFLESLIGRPRSLPEMLRSVDFWVASILPSFLGSALFFALGLFVERRRQRAFQPQRT